MRTKEIGVIHRPNPIRKASSSIVSLQTAGRAGRGSIHTLSPLIDGLSKECGKRFSAIHPFGGRTSRTPNQAPFLPAFEREPVASA
jgi:hypothetical protein